MFVFSRNNLGGCCDKSEITQKNVFSLGFRPDKSFHEEHERIGTRPKAALAIYAYPVFSSSTLQIKFCHVLYDVLGLLSLYINSPGNAAPSDMKSRQFT